MEKCWASIPESRGTRSHALPAGQWGSGAQGAGKQRLTQTWPPSVSSGPELPNQSGGGGWCLGPGLPVRTRAPGQDQGSQGRIRAPRREPGLQDRTKAPRTGPGLQDKTRTPGLTRTPGQDQGSQDRTRAPRLGSDHRQWQMQRKPRAVVTAGGPGGPLETWQWGRTARQGLEGKSAVTLAPVRTGRCF